jgi:hypothetical protein
VRVEKETTVQSKAVFTRVEILDKLGIDLDDFFLVSIEHDHPQTLVFYYLKDST